MTPRPVPCPIKVQIGPIVASEWNNTFTADEMRFLRAMGSLRLLSMLPSSKKPGTPTLWDFFSPEEAPLALGHVLLGGNLQLNIAGSRIALQSVRVCNTRPAIVYKSLQLTEDAIRTLPSRFTFRSLMETGNSRYKREDTCAKALAYHVFAGTLAIVEPGNVPGNPTFAKVGNALNV